MRSASSHFDIRLVNAGWSVVGPVRVLAGIVRQQQEVVVTWIQITLWSEEKLGTFFVASGKIASSTLLLTKYKSKVFWVWFSSTLIKSYKCQIHLNHLNLFPSFYFFLVCCLRIFLVTSFSFKLTVIFSNSSPVFSLCFKRGHGFHELYPRFTRASHSSAPGFPSLIFKARETTWNESKRFRTSETDTSPDTASQQTTTVMETWWGFPFPQCFFHQGFKNS